MALLPVTAITAAGVDPAPDPAAAGGDTLPASDVVTGRVFVEVANGSAGPLGVQVADPGKTAAGNPGTVTAVSVPAAGKTRIYIPSSAVDPATGVASLSYPDGVASLTVLAMRV